MSNNIEQVYSEHPHALVTTSNSFEAENDRDFDLLSTIQFVNEGHAVQFDFSAYVFVREDGSDLEEERKRVAEEIQAFNTFRAAVDAAHEEFLVNASKALDRLANLQKTQ